ncbi:tetratricopeptide repeat protein [Pseudomonadota bacterium]
MASTRTPYQVLKYFSIVTTLNLKDDARAVEWYRQATEHGHAKAQYNLGFICATGRGVPKDDAMG